MALAAPDIFEQGGGIQERLAMALQDPQMRERLLSQMPQIMSQLQGVNGPIAQRLAAGGGVGGMAPALQAEILRSRLASPGGGSPPFVPPGGGVPEAGIDLPGQPMPMPGPIAGPPGSPPFFPGEPPGGGPVATLPFLPGGGIDGGSPPFVPVPQGDLGAIADLRKQYGNSDQMADRRRKMIDLQNVKRPGGGADRRPTAEATRRTDFNPRNEFEVMLNTEPGSERQRRELERVRNQPQMIRAPGLETGPRGGSPPFVPRGTVPPDRGSVGGVPGQSGRRSGINPGGGVARAKVPGLRTKGPTQARRMDGGDLRVGGGPEKVVRGPATDPRKRKQGGAQRFPSRGGAYRPVAMY